MSMLSILLLGLGIAGFVYATMIYNNLVNLKHNVSKSLANIDIIIKQRHDVLPKLIDTCKQYMQYEQETLDKVIQARGLVATAQAQKNITQLGQAESALRTGLGNLFALAENYPELKANQSFMQLQQTIIQLEDSIADRREIYNESVNLNNARIEQFPDTLLATQFRFKPFRLLKFSTEELTDVDIAARFNHP